MSVKAKYIKDLPLKNALDGSESLLVQDSNGTKQVPLETIVDEIEQNAQLEKIREIESELAQTNAQLSDNASENMVVFNVHRKGADNTGELYCDELIQNNINKTKTLYFSKGVYKLRSLNTYDDYEKIIIIGEDKNNTKLVFDGTFSIRSNVEIKNITLSSKTVGKGGQLDSNPYAELLRVGNTEQKANLLIDNCILTFETPSEKSLAINVSNCYDFILKNSEIHYGGIQMIECDFINIENNVIDGHWINNCELIHIQRSTRGIIKGNRMFNTNGADFIDVYPSAYQLIIEDNYMLGTNSVFMEIKAHIRDDEPSTETYGFWHEIIIKNNFFGGQKKSTWGFNIGVYDDRVDTSVNVETYYPRNLLFDGNVIDYTTYDDDETLTNTVSIEPRIFLIQGMRDLNFINNTVKLSKYTNNNQVVFYMGVTPGTVSKRNEITKNLTIRGNTITCDDSNKIIILCKFGKHDGFAFNDNIIDCRAKMEFLAYSDNPTRENINISNNMVSKYGGSLAFYIDGVEDIKIVNQHIDYFDLINAKNVYLNNCHVKTYLRTPLDTGSVGELHVKNCEFEDYWASFSIPFKIISIIGCHIKGNGIPFQIVKNFSVNKLFYFLNSYDETRTRSVWAVGSGESLVLPTISDINNFNGIN